jgi:hypothetical protein
MSIYFKLGVPKQLSRIDIAKLVNEESAPGVVGSQYTRLLVKPTSRSSTELI